jgi:hypothetical protein
MDPPFQFTIVYDSDSARAAARVVMMRVWGRFFKVVAVLFPLSVVGALWLARKTESSWWYWMLLVLVLAHATQAYLIWAPLRRWTRRLNGSARVMLSDSDFGFASENGSHVLPWTLFNGSLRDSRNVYLFLSKSSAIVVPTKDVSQAALQFMIDHVSPARR